MESAFHDRYGLLDDMTWLSVDRYDKDLSSCVLTDGRVSGLLLVTETAVGVYTVELLFALQPDREKHMLNMMRHSVRTAKNVLGEEDRVLLSRHSKGSEKLINSLFPGKHGEAVLRGEKRDE